VAARIACVIRFACFLGGALITTGHCIREQGAEEGEVAGEVIIRRCGRGDPGGKEQNDYCGHERCYRVEGTKFSQDTTSNCTSRIHNFCLCRRISEMACLRVDFWFGQFTSRIPFWVWACNLQVE
jgi:hypothetical protein